MLFFILDAQIQVNHILDFISCVCYLAEIWGYSNEILIYSISIGFETGSFHIDEA